MIRIQRLKKPTKRSGNELKPLASTKVKGVTITNTNSFSVWVDRYTRKPRKVKRK